MRALLPTAGAMSPAPPPYVVCLPHAEPAPPPRQSLRTRLAPPGTAVAPIPAKPVVLPGTGSDETTLSRFTSILSRLEAVTDQVQELREKVCSSPSARFPASLRQRGVHVDVSSLP